MTTTNFFANDGAKRRAELESVERSRREIAGQLAEHQRLYNQGRAKLLRVATKSVLLKGVGGLRNVADRLLGWRLGMVIIYAAAILILSFFCEIILGYGFAMLAVGLVFIAVIAILHYIPADAILATQIRLAEDERGKLGLAIAEQQPLLQTLRQQKQGLDSQAAFWKSEAQRASGQWQTQPQPMMQQPQIVQPQPAVGFIAGPGTFDVDVVGESSYQDCLEKLCAPRTTESVRCSFRALLILEDSNRHDKMAVRVDIDGHTVGYFDRETARSYRKQLEIAGHPLITASCDAIVVGGWYRGPADFGYYGVKVDLPTVPPPPPPPPSAFLAGPGTFDVDVVGESYYSLNLAKVCQDAAPGDELFVTACLTHGGSSADEDGPWGSDDPEAIRVEVDGQTVGYLSPPDGHCYRERLIREGRPGITATCKAKIIVHKKRYAVKLDFVMAPGSPKR
jgi:hypothetical protein